ncbi:hypothetical protein Efla_007057 [Eimeria flavescens]
MRASPPTPRVCLLFGMVFLSTVLGAVLAQSASASALPARGLLSPSVTLKSAADAAVSQASLRSTCALICTSVVRGLQLGRLVCRPYTTVLRHPPRSAVLMLEAERTSRLALSASSSGSWGRCCPCEELLRGGPLRGPPMWGPRERPPAMTVLQSFKNVCVEFPSSGYSRLLCSVSASSSSSSSSGLKQNEKKRPEADADLMVRCGGSGVRTPPPLRSKEDVEPWLDFFIKSEKVVVFAKASCPFCETAVETLQAVAASDVCTVHIDSTPFTAEIQQALGRLTGATTVPRVFVGGAFVGGCDDVLDLAASGQLEELLEDLRGGRIPAGRRPAQPIAVMPPGWPSPPPAAAAGACERGSRQQQGPEEAS